MGKYLRHGLAVLLAAFFTWLLTVFGVVPDPEAVQGAADVVAEVFAPALMLLFYAWGEKYLKHFRWLDPEGYADRLRRKEEAARLDRARRPARP